MLSPQQIEEVVRALRGAFKEGRTRPLKWRKRQLKGLRQLLIQNEERVMEALNKDLGRCKMESVLSEISTTLDEIKLMISNLKASIPFHTF